MSLEHDIAKEASPNKDQLHDLFVSIATSDPELAYQALTQINHFIGSAQGWNPNQYAEGFFTPTYLTDRGMDFEDAIQCATDLERTRLFIQGVYANVTRKLLQDESDNPIVVVEAGPGTGILLLAAVLFGEGRVKATGLEINSKTKQKIDQLVKKADLREDITIVETDATTHEFPHDSFIDIVISENLHTGGFNEPQDQIIAHLRRYMKPDCALIPEGIELSMQLAHCSYWDTTDAIEVEADKIAQEYIFTPCTDPCTYLIINYSKDVHAVDTTQILAKNSDEDMKVNTIIFYMSVLIGKNHRNEDIKLLPGEARFLGVPHVVRLDEGKQFLLGGAKKSIRITYALGASPSDMQVIINNYDSE